MSNLDFWEEQEMAEREYDAQQQEIADAFENGYQQGRADIISQLRELEKENYCPCQQGNCMYEVSEFSCVTCYLNKIEQSLR